MKTAIYIGRFQPLHIGHLDIIKRILKKYDRIIVCIGSSNIRYTKDNPLNASERKHMLNIILKNTNHKILYIPDSKDDKAWTNNFIKRTKSYNPNIVYTGNLHTIKLLKKHTKLQIKKIKKEIDICATEIRENINKNKIYIPKKIKKYLKKINAYKRIKKLN